MLWGIQLSTRTKLSIIFLLGLGVVWVSHLPTNNAGHITDVS